MEDIPRKQMEKLESLLKSETTVPLSNRFLSDDMALAFNSSWLNQAWSHLVHTDLVEAGDLLHYRRMLRAACEEQLPQLKTDLENNDFYLLILDLVEQEYQELKDHGSMDALYLLEMASELAQMQDGKPAYLELLNLIQRHRLEYGTLESLRSNTPPGKESPTRFGKQITGKKESFDGSDTVTQFKRAAGSVDILSGFKCIIPNDTSEGYVHEKVVRLWHDFESHVNLKVSTRLNSSDYMKRIKAYLWKRQQEAESIFDQTLATCGDLDLLEKFEKKLMEVRPIIRSEMGIKIAARPEIAEKIYEILQLLIKTPISAFDFMEVFNELAGARYDGAVCEIEIVLETSPDMISFPKEIINLLRSFHDRCETLSPREKRALERRQHAAFREPAFLSLS